MRAMSPRSSLRQLLSLSLLVFLVACPTDDDDDDTTGDPDPCEGIAGVSGTDVTFETVAGALLFPVFATHAGDGSGRMFVVLQGGGVVEVSADGTQRPWLDLSDRVNSCSECGLLSIAFHPSFASNGRFFVYYTASGGGRTTVSEFGLDGDVATGVGEPGSERILLTEEQPAANHNGGQIVFGPDGFLYIGLGDGGGGGDTYGNGQRPDTFLAKILRIDVDAGDPYSVPSDNPFVEDASHRHETWAWGLRNPWRFSFDRRTGQMWIADVGQSSWEELHIGASGANYGWPEMEGNNCFTAGCDPSLYEPAIWDYGHVDGISITGGYVYRGCQMPDLDGVYFFSDYNYFNSPLWSVRWDGEEAVVGPVDIGGSTYLISSFGEDEDGELYALHHGTQGRLLKIVPAP